MDLPRGPSVALPSPSTKSHFARRLSPTRGSAQTSSESARPRKAMAIPGSFVQDIPPALPPPRYNEELANGNDIAWRWANPDASGRTHTLAPIKPGSSLLGGRRQLREPPSPPDEDDREREDEDDAAQDMELDEPMDRRGSTVTLRSPSYSEAGAGSHVPYLAMRPMSPSARSQRLHGERPLAQQSHHQSTHAYDQRLLSKIGKSNSPPRHTRSDSNDHSALGTKLSIQTRNPAHVRRPTNEPSTAAEPFTKWMASPVSSALSPGTKVNWRDLGSDHRSPSSIDSTTHSVTFDPELLVGNRSAPRDSQNGSTSSPERACGHSQRGSHDLSLCTGDAGNMSEEANFRGLQLGERDRFESHHGQGLKRRARSPPSETTRDPRPEQLQRINTTVYTHTPGSHLQSKHGSFSSSASSARQSSLASSATLSAAPSSMTSISSIDAHYPHDHSQSSPYLGSAPPTSSPTVAIMPMRKFPENSISNQVTPHSSQPAMNDTRLPPSRIGNHFICSCCPKKPKKFETEEQLRAHENEKQYACAWCHNRFKNKNEAERHQNSLHLKKTSWSCAALGNYQSAFQACEANNPHGSLADWCCFCGREFSNQPQPNWNERTDHLINVHKFGECNVSKKFFRADHFRQHLKHSHGGKSGKWTTALENQCQREEAASNPASLSPTASEHSQGGAVGRAYGGFPDPTSMPMAGEAIDEMREES